MSKFVEFKKPRPCITPLGECLALGLFDLSTELNTIWLCQVIATGAVKHVVSEEIRLCGNPTWNIPEPKPFKGRNV